jgi:peptide/nickel transport system permease protein
MARIASVAVPAQNQSVDLATGALETKAKRSRRRAILDFVHDPGNALGLLILTLMAVWALFAPQIAPHDPNAQLLSMRLRPPLWAGGTATYLLGTDDLGRDLLSRIIYGTRISLLVGFVSAVGAALLGTGVGLVAGYFGGRLDVVLMRIVDVWMAFPFILLALATIAVLGPGLRNLIIVFVITGWMVYARVSRAATLSLREMEFVSAARAMGARNPRIVLHHILPNLAAPIIVLTSFQIASLIMAEAALSFLGLGVRPPTPAWGSMMASGRGLIQEAWWISTLPGLALALTVLGINLLGDGLRDALDARVD